MGKIRINSAEAKQTKSGKTMYQCETSAGQATCWDAKIMDVVGQEVDAFITEKETDYGVFRNLKLQTVSAGGFRGAGGRPDNTKSIEKQVCLKAGVALTETALSNGLVTGIDESAKVALGLSQTFYDWLKEKE